MRSAAAAHVAPLAAVLRMSKGVVAAALAFWVEIHDVRERGKAVPMKLAFLVVGSYFGAETDHEKVSHAKRLLTVQHTIVSEDEDDEVIHLELTLEEGERPGWTRTRRQRVCPTCKLLRTPGW